MDNNKDLSTTQTPPPKKGGLLKRLFGNRNELDIYTEEQVQSPWRTVLRTFRSNKVSMTALIVFLVIVLIVFIGPLIRPVDLGYAEVTQVNLGPSREYMAVPNELLSDLNKMENGRSFGVGINNSGKVFIWGDTRITNRVNIRNVPDDLPPLVDIAVGDDHVLGLTDEGTLVAWGNDRQRQSRIPWELEDVEVVQIDANYQTSGILDAEGNTYLFGNVKNMDYVEFHEWQGQIKKIALSVDALVGLTNEGKIVYFGRQSNSYSKVPEGTFTDIAAASKAFAAVRDDGEIVVWGNLSYRGEGRVPEHESPAVQVEGGRYHFTALLEDGSVIAWGENTYKQSDVPAALNGKKVTYLSSNYYQNYAITDNNELVSWGLKGYLLGSDDLGRDIFIRLLNGGRMTITIGAVAVLIATFIGIVIGGLSGYFGGTLDLVLQRFSEVIASLPFLPFAMILNVIIGNSLSPSQRVYLMMVVLGLLSWTGLQRLVRAQVFSVREQEFVVAAKAMGIREGNIVFRHIIPNVISVIIVSTTLSFASSMLTESSLSFLGFGVQPPIPTWGNMLFGSNNSVVIQTFWWRWVFTSIILSITVISVNLIGDGLRDAIDPKSQER